MCAHSGPNTNPPASDVIVRAESAVTLVGPGETAAQDLDELLAIAPRLVAADGGAARALEAGHAPEAVIGDLDSLPQFVREALPPERFHRIDEQETTDFEKCLMRIAAPVILATGFTGGRLDHELAVYNALARHPLCRCIVVGAADLVFLAPLRLELALDPGARVSLFPLDRVTGRSTGLDWPIEGLDFAPGGRVGTSNRATDGRVTLDFDRSGMLVILPRAALGPARVALASG